MRWYCKSEPMFDLTESAKTAFLGVCQFKDIKGKQFSKRL